jgi:hypothetical protein
MLLLPSPSAYPSPTEPTRTFDATATSARAFDEKGPRFRFRLEDGMPHAL